MLTLKRHQLFKQSLWRKILINPRKKNIQKTYRYNKIYKKLIRLVKFIIKLNADFSLIV
jgi:hypothetical protein